MLSFSYSLAHADLWAYVDEQGVTHFAAEKADARYQLFFKSADASANRLALDARAQGLLNPPKAADKAAAGKPVAAKPAFEMPERFAKLDASKGYKAVQKHLKTASKAHKVDYELLKAVIAAESGFDPAAVSPRGAVGLMQLLPTTAEQYGVVADKEDRKDKKGNLIPAQTAEQKLADPLTNVQAGARHLAYLLKLFKGDTELAVAAYNAGEGAVQRAGNKVPNYKETQGYVKTVMGLYGVFKPAPADAGTALASASILRQPVAQAVGRIGANSRVRVQLGQTPTAPVAKLASASAPAKAASPVVAATAAADAKLVPTEMDSAIKPVVFTLPSPPPAPGPALAGPSGE